MRKILNLVRNLGIVLLILLVILFGISKFKRSDYILNFAPMKVLSGSMEPKLKVGDLIVARKVNPLIIKEGDIITYKINNRTNVTHRVVEIFDNSDETLFKTKGDANNIEDKDLVVDKNLVGKLVFKIPKFGYFIDFITQPFGFALLFILPTIVLISKEVFYDLKI